MAKRSGRTQPNKPSVDMPVGAIMNPPEEIKPTIVIQPPVMYNTVRRLRNRIQSNFRYVGKSGVTYNWSMGETVSVRSEDADELLKKTYGAAACCGSSTKPLYIFEEV